MRDIVRQRFVEFTADLEGVIPHMYLDIKGLVTVAIGNLIDPIAYAMPLPFVRSDGSPAPRDVIAAEWLRIAGQSCYAAKARPQGMPTDQCPWRGTAQRCLAHLGWRAAAASATLRLDDDGVQLVVSRKLSQNEDHLRRRFAEWDEWPACAQLATMSMAWACGPAFRYPMLAAYLNAQDWAAASKECHIDERGNPGLIPRNERNKRLYRNAARVRDFHLDPDTLDWEVELDVTEKPTQPAVENPASTPSVIVRPRHFDEEWTRDVEPDEDA